MGICYAPISTIMFPLVLHMSCVLCWTIPLAAQPNGQDSGDQKAEAQVAQWMDQFTEHSRQRQFDKALAALDQIEKLNKDRALTFYLRGRTQFQRAAFKESVADFDQYVKLEPRLESRQWERGISMYYARQYKRGAEQFELYQTYHNQDVENSVWRFLCMTPAVGVEKAREVMLPIENDPRIPMMKIFELYRGTATPADVLKDVGRGDPNPNVRAARSFYAHLYLGLFYEVTKNSDKARKYIELAAKPNLVNHPGINSYMWDVARVHWDQMQQAKKR